MNIKESEVEVEATVVEYKQNNHSLAISLYTWIRPHMMKVVRVYYPILQMKKLGLEVGGQRD